MFHKISYKMINTCFPHNCSNGTTKTHSQHNIFRRSYAYECFDNMWRSFFKHNLTEYYYYYYYHYVGTTNMHSVDYIIHKQSRVQYLYIWIITMSSKMHYASTTLMMVISPPVSASGCFTSQTASVPQTFISNHTAPQPSVQSSGY